MSAEDDRTKETATVLAKAATSVFPADKLAPWMSHYDKKTEAVIVGIKTIADVGEELDRQVWRLTNGNSKQEEPEEGDEPMFDTTKLEGAAYIFGFGLNRLAHNMHNFAPSIDGIRTKQAIALGKATNPGVAAQPDQPPKKTGLSRLNPFSKAKEQ